jgi:hypothetical protein
MIRVRITQPSFLTVEAGIARSKNIQTWPPFPDRERSNAAGTLSSLQAARNATVSSFGLITEKKAKLLADRHLWKSIATLDFR